MHLIAVTAVHASVTVSITAVVSTSSWQLRQQRPVAATVAGDGVGIVAVGIVPATQVFIASTLMHHG